MFIYYSPIINKTFQTNKMALLIFLIKWLKYIIHRAVTTGYAEVRGAYGTPCLDATEGPLHHGRSYIEPREARASPNF